MIFGKKEKEDVNSPNLHWHTVESSFVEAVAYDGATGDLYITLTHGSYIYEGVPAHKFEEFLLASSKGSYFNANFRNLPFTSR